MKTVVILFLLFSTRLSFGQNSSLQSGIAEKSITITFSNSLGRCSVKAVFIKADTVMIDTCYNNADKIFSSSKTASINTNNLYSRLMNITAAQWQQIEADINKVKTCDFAIPFEVTLTENGRLYKYSLKRISNCYPESGRYILEALENYFINI